MGVTRSLVAVALCFLFLASIGCMSFSFAELAIELLLVGSAFLGCVAFLVASIACLYGPGVSLYLLHEDTGHP